VAAILIVAALGVAAAAYFQIWVPAQENKIHQEAERANLENAQRARAADEAEVRERERKAKDELVAGMAARADAGAATTSATDAGTGGSAAPGTPGGSTEPPRGSAAPAAPVPSGRTVARTTPAVARGRSFDDWLSQGDREREHARARAALSAYGRAIAVEPSRPEGYVGRGRALLTLGDSGSAIAAFRKALGVNSRYSVAEFWLGEAYRRAGQNTEAAAAFGRYLEAAPEGAEAAQAREALNGLR
jgi:tetratricopeptide (TPR) repeat protein